MTRQAVQNHLDRLVETGLVRVRLTQRKGKRGLQEYALDLARLFAVIEELRKFTLLAPSAPIEPLATEGDAPALGARAWEDGPKLVLVHGVGEGIAHPLRARELHPPRGWVVGRREGCAVRLEYDPYVSHENAEIIPVGRGFRLLDLRTSRNRAHLNWTPLEPGGEAELRHGDVVGVGRSLLVFREA